MVFEEVCRYQDGRSKPQYLHAQGCKDCLIKIIQVEIYLAVVALEAAKILHMQVAAYPCLGAVFGRTEGCQSVIKQMAGAAIKTEGALLYGLELGELRLCGQVFIIRKDNGLSVFHVYGF